MIHMWRSLSSTSPLTLTANQFLTNTRALHPISLTFNFFSSKSIFFSGSSEPDVGSYDFNAPAMAKEATKRFNSLGERLKASQKHPAG